MTKLAAGLIMSLLIANGYWPLEKSQPIVEKTQTIRLAPDISQLSDGERKAVAKLIEVGQIFQNLYELQRHPEALTSYRALEQLNKQNGGTPATQNLLTLFRLFQGPIATTLDNKREAPASVLVREHLYRGQNWTLAYHSALAASKEGAQQIALRAEVGAKSQLKILYVVVYTWGQ